MSVRVTLKKVEQNIFFGSIIHSHDNTLRHTQSHRNTDLLVLVGPRPGTSHSHCIAIPGTFNSHVERSCCRVYPQRLGLVCDTVCSVSLWARGGGSLSVHLYVGRSGRGLGFVPLHAPPCHAPVQQL